MYSPPKPAPHSFYAYACESTDRYSRPTLRRRLAPLGLLAVQGLNVVMSGSIFYFVGWLMLLIFHSGKQPFCYTYLAGTLYAVCFAMAYVFMQTCFVITKNFIWPT